MEEPSQQDSVSRRSNEYEDPHFHDDEETPQSDDMRSSGERLPAKRKPIRKLPSRRHYED